MSRQGVRRRAAAGCAAVILGVAGCSSSSADGPGTTTGSAAPSASVISVPSTGSGASGSSSPTALTPSVIDVPTVVATPTSLDPDAQEAADRAAVEAQWTKFWITYDGIVRTAPDERLAQLNMVAVPPVTENVLQAASDADQKGIDNYGTWIHRLSWQFPINGSSTAVVADCQDQSETGTYEVASGKVLTVGKERSNMRGEFTKGQDGVWRLQTLYLIGDTGC